MSNKSKEFQGLHDIAGMMKGLQDRLSQSLDKVSSLAVHLDAPTREAVAKINKDIRKGVANGDFDIIDDAIKQAETIKKTHGNTNNREGV